jgi:hypothetical protein
MLGGNELIKNQLQQTTDQKRTINNGSPTCFLIVLR